MKRLDPSPTQRIDRGRPVRAFWQGRPLAGLAGDTVASALVGAGVRVVGRSLKYHRPRGVFSLDGESANALVEVDGECNVFAESRLLRPGMRVRAQNYLGRVENDLLGFLDVLSPFMPAGFYYRTMHRPRALWPLFTRFIRAMAGTGRPGRDAGEAAGGRRQEQYLNAEVCVIGGGPAGLAAALAAAGAGARVVLFEARPWLGGFYDWRAAPGPDGRPLFARGRELAARAGEEPGIRAFTSAPVVDASGDNLVTACQEQDGGSRYLQVRARAVVVATGCGERPLVFEHNERPGVMLPSAAWRLAATWAVAAGRRAVFSVADDLGLEAAAELARAGVAVAAVADARTAGANPELVQALSGLGAEHLPGWAVSRAEGRRGVRAAVLASRDGRQSRRVECDLLAASAGPSPVTGPLSTLGAALAWDSATGFHLPASLPPGVFAAGRLLGLAAPEAVEAAGRLAGLQAAGHAGADTRARAEGARRELAGLPGPEPGAGLVRGPLGGRGRKSFVCFDEDGTYKTLAQSARAGFDRPELAKRFGGFGLGPGQAGVPGRNLPLALAGLAGAGPEQMGPTTERPPLRPVLMAAAAGPGHQVCKETAMHRPQAEAGAVFRRVGPWLRARYFSADRTSREEIQAVRRGVGLIDVSTLGKFRLFGPDAEKALQRVYISDMSRTREGRLKYSAMLNPDGMLVDDGVVTRLGGDDFYLTTSTGRAGQTIQWLRYHTRHQDWDYHLVNLTDQLAAVNLAGPKSREILARLTDADLSPEAFPFMACREILLNGAVPARALRVGFVGELSYELHFPASYGEAVWGWLMEAGAQAGIRPFGLEAQGTLRLEKGHVIIGQETEQRVNLLDLGLGFLWDRDDTASGKVGAPALRFTHDQAGRHRLTGLELSAAEGAGLLDGAVAYEGEAIQGYVCTCRYSPALDKIIGLALVREHLAAPGTELTLYQNLAGRAQRFTARAVRPPFYDPDGERLRS